MPLPTKYVTGFGFSDCCTESSSKIQPPSNGLWARDAKGPTLRIRAPDARSRSSWDRLSVVARCSFAVLVVFARCRLFLYIFGAKFFAHAQLGDGRTFLRR